MSSIRTHHDCVQCGSSDAATTYDTGWTKCFSCGANYREDGEYMSEGESPVAEGLLPTGKHLALKKRGISLETCQKYDYKVSKYGTDTVQVANYRRNRKVVAQHLRYPDKRFSWLGNTKGIQLFGQHLWQEGGKTLTICEGEIDTLTFAQVRGLKWPVVGLTGATQIQQVKDNIEFVSSFDEVLIYMDMDEPGQALAEQIANLIPPGKARIASLPCKDVNETYLEKGSDGLYSTIWQCKTYSPQEITTATEVFEYEDADRSDYSYPYPSMQENSQGQSFGEIVCIGAGTSVGKSTVLRALAHDLLTKGKTIGYIPLEEKSNRVLNYFLSMDVGCSIFEFESKPIETKNIYFNSRTWKDNLILYTHRGSNAADIMFDRIRYMVIAHGVKYIFLDHISAVFSGMDGDERKQIDKFMYAIQSLAKELNILIFCASHLKDPGQGKPLEEGGKTSINLLRGSRSIGQVFDTVWGVERNCLDEDERGFTKIVSLKQRYSGNTGHCCWLTMGDNHVLTESVKTTLVNDGDEF